jgi:hypothetical protein
VVFWTNGAPPRLDRNNFTARLCSVNRISFAVVSDESNRDWRRPPGPF